MLWTGVHFPDNTSKSSGCPTHWLCACTAMHYTRTAHLGMWVMAEGESCVDFILIRRLRAIAQLIVFSMMEGNFKLNRCVCACLRACVCVSACVSACVCVCVCVYRCMWLSVYIFLLHYLCFEIKVITGMSFFFFELVCIIWDTEIENVLYVVGLTSNYFIKINVL